MSIKKPVPSKSYDKKYYLHQCGGHEVFSTEKLSDKFTKVFNLVNVKNKEVVDIGCGRGEVVKQSIIRGASLVYGIDYSTDALKIASGYCSDLDLDQKKRIRFLKLDAKKIDSINHKFDIVFMLDIIEHLHEWELERVYKGLELILKENGKVIIHTYPTKYQVLFSRIIMKIIGMKSIGQKLHVNEQTIPILRKQLSKYLIIKNIWLEREKDFWERNVGKEYWLIKKIAGVFDRILNFFIISFLLSFPILKDFFYTDIWVIARPYKK